MRKKEAQGSESMCPYLSLGLWFQCRRLGSSIHTSNNHTEYLWYFSDCISYGISNLRLNKGASDKVFGHYYQSLVLFLLR